MDVTVKIEVYDGFHFLNLDVILSMCVGGTDLFQWKQGNTWFKSVLKDLSQRDLFFCLLKKVLTPEHKNIYGFYKNN